MSDEIVSLNEARAQKASDNKLWTPLDCAEAFVRDIKSGKARPQRALILYEEPEPDGGFTINAYAANMQRDTEIALLHMRLHAATHKWQRG